MVGTQQRLPDPQDVATYERSRLDWTELGEPHRSVLEWYRSLIELRKSWPELTDGRLDAVDVTLDETARWIVVRRGRVAVACNLAGERQHIPLPATATSTLLASTTDVDRRGATLLLGPESVAVLGLG